VIIDEANRSMEVIVPDESLSVAIGKHGQNVRLASRLTGWRLDVTSESRYSQAMQYGYDSLIALPGIGVSSADALYEKGFFSVEELSQSTVEDLIQIRGIAEDKAKKLIEAAKETVERLAAVDEIPDDTSPDETSESPEGLKTPEQETSELKVTNDETSPSDNLTVD
jgi:N utilization substance protein A